MKEMRKEALKQLFFVFREFNQLSSWLPLRYVQVFFTQEKIFYLTATPNLQALDCTNNRKTVSFFKFNLRPKCHSFTHSFIHTGLGTLI